MRIILAALAAVVLFMPFTSPANASEYSKAKKHGTVDLSYGCPRGSAWDPRNGGECRACPKGSKMVLFECRTATPPIMERAIYHSKKGSIFAKCPKGTFVAGLTTKCFRCRKGLSHNGALPVEVPGVCFKLPTIKNHPARSVAKVSFGKLIDPRNLGQELQKLGCGHHGKGAFFDPIAGGSCWSCPSGHPRRTLYSVAGPKACASKQCGKLGGRPCLVWERIPSCNKGLLEDPIRNICIKPADLACDLPLGVAKGVTSVIRKASAAGQDVTNATLMKIPGMPAVFRFIENQTAHAQRAAAKTMSKIPLEKALADLDRAFSNPQIEAKAQAVTSALQKRQKDLRRALYQGDTPCSVRMENARKIFRSALAEAGIRPEEPTGTPGRLFGDLFGPNAAHASDPVMTGWTIAYSLSSIVNVKFKGVTVPLQIGVQFAYQLGTSTSSDSFSMFLTAGIDVLTLPKPDTQWAIENFISFSWPAKACQPSALGAGLMIADTIGVGFTCSGISNVSVKFLAYEDALIAKKNPAPTINVFDTKNALTATYSSAKFKRGGKAKGPKPDLSMSLGPNVMLPLFTVGNITPKGGFAQ